MTDRDTCLVNGAHVEARNAKGEPARPWETAATFAVVRWSGQAYADLVTGLPTASAAWAAGATVLRDEPTAECGEAVAS
jgi:hypothetical protein